MKSVTPSPSVSSAPTKSFEKVFGEVGTATSRTRAPVYVFEAYTAPQPQTPVKHTSVGQLVAEWEQDARGSVALKEGRKWVEDAFYGEDGDTLRTLRLRKGWSQTRLAEELSTSQPHIVRIERGTENLTIETCRKLAKALSIDLNTLDQALKRQETIWQARQK